jgi:pimeloyl-ACP methyl ester carboxylesterase
MFSNKLVWKRSRSFIQRFAIGYSLLCIALYFQQQWLMFFPTHQLEHTPSLYQLNYQDVWIPISKTEGQSDRIHGWWIPAEKPDAPVMLYFHHNAINIGANVSQALQFHKLGYSIFLFDYRGFGQSEGAFPTEPQLYEDAQATWNYLTQARKLSPNRIVIYGHSVGGAMAIDLAAKHPEAAALVVQSTFTSMRDMTKRFGVYWFLPIELVLRQRFESLEKMKSIKMPVLIMTGTEDVQIPVEMGERLYAAAPGFKQLIIIQGGGHDK